MNQHLLCLVFAAFAVSLCAAEKPDVYKDKCELPYVYNGFHDYHDYFAPLNAKVRYYCEDNYRMEGQAVLTCTPKGWKPPPPVCKGDEVRCPRQIPSLENGIIDGPDQDYYYPGQGLWYICNKGYVLNGVQDVFCLENGQWDHPPPTCEPGVTPCQRREPPVKGSQTPDIPVYEPETSVSYACQDPYVLTGRDSALCLPNGQWSNKVPTCEPPVCRDLVKPQKGYFEVQNGNGKLTPGTMVLFFCFDHYRLVGARKLTCLDNGHWSDREPKCVPVRCEPLTPPQDGSLRPRRPFYKVGDRVKFDCDDNFDLVGSDESTCLNTGEFSSPPPTCEPQQCSRPVLDNGKFSEDRESYEVGEFVFFMCNDGYVLQGKEVLTCTETGRWSDEFPICIPVQCERPFFDNGSLQEDKESYDFQEVLKFICDFGFRLEGLQKLECTSSGQWSDNIPVCIPIQCVRPTFANGVLIQDKEVYELGDEVQFVCNEGYTLSGKEILDCLPSGEWSHDFPVCIPNQCERPTIDNGSFEDDKPIYDVDDVVQFSCDVGYILQGEELLTCTSSGDWSDSFPVCIPVVCKRPDFPNGQLTPDQEYYDVDGMISFECNRGFRRQGPKKVTCQANGNFHPNIPTCVPIKCDRPHFDNGYLDEDKDIYEIHDIVVFNCNPGYKLVGRGSLKCLQDGEWSDDFPICKPVMCEAPEIVDGSFLPVKELYQVDDKVKFECDDGFILHGPMMVTCRKNAQWSDRFPICRPVTCEVPFIDNGSFEDVKDEYFVGDEVTFQCNPNFYLDGVDNIVCQIDGTWSDDFPVCNQFVCEVPAINDGGFQPVRDEYFLDDSVKFFCDDGFSLQGPKTITCEDFGQWSDDFPTCQPNTCERPFIENGSFEDDSQDEYAVGDMVVFECDEGFRLRGSKKITCESDGQWSDRFPICREVTCRRPVVDDDVSFAPSRNSYDVGDVVTFSCDRDSTLVGAEKVECLPTGQWDDDFPTCQENMCVRPSINDGSFSPVKDSYDVSDKVEFECNRGFDLVGVEEIHCRADGSWSADFPTCERVTCVVPNIGDGSFTPVQGQYYYRDVVTFSCNDGFTLNGRSTIKCLETGKWSHPFPTCDGNMCDPPQRNPNIISITPSKNSYAVDDEVTFKCRPGFVLVGSETSVCQADTTWSPVEPTCRKVIQCRAPTTPRYATADPDDQDIFNVGETITYECRRGFTLEGESVITCQDNGKFSPNPPICKRPTRKCRAPYVPRYGSYTPEKRYYDVGEKIEFSCAKPYALRGDSHSTCQRYGRFHPRTPSCVRQLSNTCKDRCNDSYDRNQPCQCSRYCKYVSYGCCSDYKSLCSDH